jgi:tetratricopeptide (TPR) repeat protein
VLLDSAMQTVLVPGQKRRTRRVIRTLIRVGQASLAAERYADAILLAERAGVLAASGLRPSDLLQGAIEALFADAYAGRGQFEQAHEHYENALESFRLAKGESSPELGALLASMAAALARQERWREAREAGLEAIEILDSADNARLPEALNALAELDARRGRLAEAEGLRLSICHLWERLGGKDSAALAREYERRAELLRSMQRISEAGYLLGKAQRIRQTAVAGA